MAIDKWFASKKGYTTAVGGERVTVFWVGDKDAPWRYVIRGSFSDGFRTMSDAMDAVDAKVGTKINRHGCVDIEPSQRDEYTEHVKKAAEQAAMDEAAKNKKHNSNAYSEFMERLRKKKQMHEDNNSRFRREYAGQHQENPGPFGSGGTFEDFLRNSTSTGTGAGAQSEIDKEIEKMFTDAARRARAKQAAEDAAKHTKGKWHYGDSFGEAFNRFRQTESGQTEERAAPPPRTQTRRPWWEVLEVNMRCTAAEAKTAFRKLAMLHHPDRGGTNEKMAELNTAWEQACSSLNIK